MYGFLFSFLKQIQIFDVNVNKRKLEIPSLNISTKSRIMKKDTNDQKIQNSLYKKRLFLSNIEECQKLEFPFDLILFAIKINVSECPVIKDAIPLYIQRIVCCDSKGNILILVSYSYYRRKTPVYYNFY